MSTHDLSRTAARARKAMAYSIANAADAKAQRKSARAVARAERGVRHSRSRFLEELRLGDLLADLEGA